MRTKVWSTNTNPPPYSVSLMTRPGAGALTALAFMLIVGEAEGFQCSKQVAAYWVWFGGQVERGEPTAKTYQQTG